MTQNHYSVGSNPTASTKWFSFVGIAQLVVLGNHNPSVGSSSLSPDTKFQLDGNSTVRIQS